LFIVFSHCDHDRPPVSVLCLVPLDIPSGVPQA